MTTKMMTQMTKEKALESIRANHPNEAAYLESALRKDIVVLGVDDAFALRDADGEIRAFKQSLTLSLAEGGLVQPVYNGPYVISAQGYEQWSEATGTSVIFPKEVLVDGKWEPNPAVVRDPANRRILCVYARAVAFRFSSKGIPQVSDWTTIFDSPSYRLFDLLGKAKKFPQAFKLLPADMGRPEETGTWASYPFDESTNLWVNTAHEEALTWYAQIMNREKKSLDFAQTFAKRNALKHLSGLQKAPGPQWTIPILCWRPTNGNIIKWDATQYFKVQNKVGGLITGNGSEFQTTGEIITIPRIEAKTGHERVSDEQNFEEHERVIDPEDAQDVSPPADLPPYEPPTDIAGAAPDNSPVEQPLQPANLSPEEQAIMNNLAVAMDDFADEYKAACKILKMKANGKHEPFEARLIMQKINEQLDAM